MSRTQTNRPEVVLVNRCLMLSEQNEILFIKRSATDSYYPGLWEFPGGKVEIGEDLRHAMENEALEETGFLVRVVYPLSWVDDYVIGGDSKYIGKLYCAIFKVCRIIGGKLKLSKEHDDAKWLTSDKALETLDLTPEVHKALIAISVHFGGKFPK